MSKLTIGQIAALNHYIDDDWSLNGYDLQGFNVVLKHLYEYKPQDIYEGLSMDELEEEIERLARTIDRSNKSYYTEHLIKLLSGDE